MKQWCLRWSSLKSRLVEANTNPCSEIRDLICYKLIYTRENIITYSESVKHMMNTCILLLMDVPESCLSCIWLMSADAVCYLRLLQKGSLLRSRLIPSTFLSSWAKFSASLELKEDQPGQPLGAECGMGNGSQGHCSHWTSCSGKDCAPQVVGVFSV